MNLEAIYAWINANPWATTAIVVYVVLTVVPRPDPDQLTGLGRVFWVIIDRLAFLTRDRLPGRLKMVLLESPRPKPPSTKADEPEEADPPAVTDAESEPEEEETKDTDKDEEGDDSDE